MDDLLYTRISTQRIGVLIGSGGKTKKKLEEFTGTRMEVDSESGEVTIDESGCQDPVMGLRAKDVVQAIGRGFSDSVALGLLEEEFQMRVFDIKDFANNPSRLKQLKGRVIGAGGKTRRLVEELTGSAVSVYGHTVAIIGTPLQLDITGRAVEMLLQGSEHAAVYRYLEKMRPQVRMEEMGF